MRVLLVNPFYPISETPSPPLGLAYLASALKSAGMMVKILDLVVHPYRRSLLENLLKSVEPQMVGITAVTMNFDNAVEVVRSIKLLNPKILTVMGGPHVTFCAEDTLKEHPELDIIVKGEGERTIVELSRAAGNGNAFEDIKGIVYRDGSQIRHTPERPPIGDLDRLPLPARELLPLGRYRTLGMPVSMITSRGCPFQCIFCVGRKMVGARVRYRDPRSVVDEMTLLSRLGFHQINIADDLFTASPKHCLAVCDEILIRGLKLKWTSFARVDTVSKKVLSRMKAAGCTGVSFGIETADPDILKTVKKGITLKQVKEAVAMCRDTGVTPFASFVLGLPGETEQTLQKTVAFAEALEAQGVAYGYHLLAPFPGTAVREKSEAYGLTILTNDWSQYHANRAIVETEGVTAARLDDIVIRWKARYDAYLGDIERRLEKGDISSEEAAPLINLERTVLLYDLMMEGLLESQCNGEHEALNGAVASDRLERLIDTVQKRLGTPAEKTRDALTWAMEQGHIHWVVNEGSEGWGWRNTI